MSELINFLLLIGFTKDEIVEGIKLLYLCGGIAILTMFIDIEFGRFRKYKRQGIEIIQDRKTSKEHLVYKDRKIND